MPPQDRILYALLWSKSKGIPQEKVSFLNWTHEKWIPSLPERLLCDLSLLFTSVIATSLIANYLILCYICGCLVGTLSVYAYMQILLALGGAINTLNNDQHFLSQEEFLAQIKCNYYGFRNEMPRHCWYFQRLDTCQIPGKYFQATHLCHFFHLFTAIAESELTSRFSCWWGFCFTSIHKKTESQQDWPAFYKSPFLAQAPYSVPVILSNLYWKMLSSFIPTKFSGGWSFILRPEWAFRS